jgi:hypothetical protein
VLARVVVSQRISWAVLLCAAMTVWLVAVPLVLLPEKHTEDEFLTACLLSALMAVFMLPVVLLGLHCLLRKVEIQRTATHLVVRRFCLGFWRTKSYLLADIRNVRAYGPEKNSAYSRKFELLMDYHGETIPLVRRLTLAKAHHLIEQLMK